MPSKRTKPVTGRPSKGDRDVFLTRVPRPVGDAVRARAEELDLSYSECVAELLASALGMPQHVIRSKDRDQGELPLTKAS